MPTKKSEPTNIVSQKNGKAIKSLPNRDNAIGKVNKEIGDTRKISKAELEEEKRQKTKDKLLSEEKINIAFSDPLHSSTKHTIYTQDNKSIPEIESSSVHLAVTSPPYFNAREYSTWKTVEDYLADMTKSFQEVFRVLKPGRKFCLNISDLPEKGESGRKGLAALGAAAREHLAAVLGGHTQAEAMGALAVDSAGLIRALHGRAPSRRVVPTGPGPQGNSVGPDRNGHPKLLP